MSRFDFVSTGLKGLTIVKRTAVEDPRGFLSRLYCAEQFGKAGFTKPIAQVNHTFTSDKGTVRGLHFQYPPQAEVKLVSCLQGEVFDIAVDLRRDSPTFLQWHGELLSATNRTSLLIPEGFAHGFQTLMANCELIYLHTTAYHPECEGALNATDPLLNIAWPIAITDMSEKDRNHKLIERDFEGLVL
ncbi:MAG: dTDP-4-dehydrorhamnose 3,5-epimerase [Porticoccaceae bacterium]